jgi:hypothetical protein
MTVPGNVSAKKLAGDYLADLTHVALRYLPKGDRMKFVGRIQALIERRCGPLTEAEPGRVAAFLAELGEPRELVMRERARLDQALAKRRAAGQVPAAPWEQRPLTSRWRPATGDRMRRPRAGRLLGGRGDRQEPPTGPAPAAGEWTPPVPAEDWSPTGGTGGAAAAGSGAGRGPETASADVAGYTALEPAEPGPGEGPGTGLAAIEPTSVVPPQRPPLPPVPAGAVAPGPPTIPGLTLPGDPGSQIVPAGSTPGTLVPWTPAGLGTLARANRREALAVSLLAAGVLLPLPFWLLGAAVAGFSRFWEARYRWVALYGPVLVTLVVSLPLAVFAAGHGNVVGAYVHMIGLDARYLVRLGCLLTAAFLTWLVRRGPRERIPPWRR